MALPENKSRSRSAAVARIETPQTPAVEPSQDALTLARERAARLARRTFTRSVLNHAAGAQGAFSLDAERYPDPVLLAATAQAGAKLRLAAELGLHSTVGADLVNRCVNDIAVQAGTPLFFFDTVASGAIAPAVVESVVGGIAEACKGNGAVLLGGDVAEVPEVYAGDAYDLSGVLVGVVSRARMFPTETIQPGDMLVGLPSNGLHSSGQDVAQRLLLQRAGYGPDQYVNALKDKVGASLMRAHRSYLAPVRKLIQGEVVSACMHISGGGLAGCIEHMLPKGVAAQLEPAQWQPAPLFEHLQTLSDATSEEMMRTYNMGIGLVAVVPAAKLRQARLILNRMNERHVIIGRVLKGERRILFC